MAGSTPAIVPSASSTDEATTLEIKNTCLEAVNGDEAAEISCIKTILEHAEHMRVDELVADFKTNCLVIPTLSYGDLIWAYLGWLEEHPETDEKSSEEHTSELQSLMSHSYTVFCLKKIKTL